ncbi:hypothetical protein AWB74_03406 [Caballeronia arvi]|uniref:Uncharacterized protein n=1 Tax=Caballeronia arvi TaxID=1777135 RepID=A0A158J4Q5_9BURK|nr:hypothetical protein AWB74_03406 [Caballeronia arvi]
MASAELADIPASELVNLLDYCVWNLSHSGRSDVLAWRAELLARADANTPEVSRAVAVCDEYLAPEGSPEALAATAKAWPNL